MDLSKDNLLFMYWFMLLARRLDERAWALHHQGKIAYHISGIGQEAIQVGAAFAIDAGQDWIVPYYRDLALLLALGLTPEEYMLNLMGKAGDPNSGGRQMPAHWSLKRANVISQGGSAAAHTAHAAGIALGLQLRAEPHMVLTTLGEGATSQGDWYESMNWAAIRKLPLVCLVENNRYAISTPQAQQMAVDKVSERARGLGLPGVTVDGSDFTAVFRVVKDAAERARRGEGPTLVEAITYRITPHSSDDDDRTYRTQKEVEEHRRKDPLKVSKAYLEKEGVLSFERSSQMDIQVNELVEQAVQAAEQAPDPQPEAAAGPVYAQGETPCP